MDDIKRYVEGRFMGIKKRETDVSLLCARNRNDVITSH